VTLTFRTVIPLALLWACSSGGDDDDGDSACFAAGTEVATPHGEVAIEELRPGDEVLSRDRHSGASVTAIVTQTRRHRDRAYRVLEVPGGRRLAVTDNHPIFNAALGDFVPAGRLSSASRLITLDGPSAGVRSSGAGRGDVYDLSVTGDHVFFAAGVLVHNKTPDAGPPTDAHACGGSNACQEWPGLPPDTVHGYLFDGCDTPGCCVEPSDWWAAGTFAEQPEEGATVTPLERALPDPAGAFEVTASDDTRFLCAGEPLVDGDLAVVGACVELPPPRSRIDYVSGPGGGVWLSCGQL
jgi:hypothetical protein